MDFELQAPARGMLLLRAHLKTSRHQWRPSLLICRRAISSLPPIIQTLFRAEFDSEFGDPVRVTHAPQATSNASDNVCMAVSVSLYNPRGTLSKASVARAHWYRPSCQLVLFLRLPGSPRRRVSMNFYLPFTSLASHCSTDTVSAHAVLTTTCLEEVPSILPLFLESWAALAVWVCQCPVT